MYPLSDKDLDRLSREAAEQFAVEPHASDWDQLESRLDKELPVQKEKKRRRILWLFLLFLLSCGSGLFWLLNNKETNKPAGITTTSKETNPATSEAIILNDKTAVIPGTTESDIQKNNSNARKNEPVVSVNPNSNLEAITPSVNNNQEPVNVAVATPAPSGIKEKVPGKQQGSEKRNKNFSASLSKKGTKTPTAGLVVNTPINKPKANLENASQTDISSQKINEVVPSKTLPPSETNKITNEPNKAITPVTPVAVEKESISKLTEDSLNNKTAVAKKIPAKKGTPLQRGFSIGIQAGLDFSRINKTGNNDAGYDFGLQLSYRLTKHWSFNTGLIITKKNYTAKGSDFHPPKHYWTTYIALNNVAGNCQMWDIPINIRYDITTSKTKWFVSSGLSSYIMRKQYYNYYYTVNSVPREKEWNMNSQTNYWFNVLNISAGVEKQLSRTWSIQAEPFIKAPLKGVGFGNMNINSYGVLATLKFHPVFKH